MRSCALFVFAAVALRHVAARWSSFDEHCPGLVEPKEGDDLATRVLLSDAAKADGAVCLDGTPGAFYFRPGNQSTRWYIHMQGGGWCESLEDCAGRANTTLGSSKDYPPQASLGGGYFSQNPADNPMMFDWNAVFIRYCDGASFSGNNETTETVGEMTLHFRGHRVLRAAMDYLNKYLHLGDSTDVVVSGCSAGGLATYLHVDEWRSVLPAEAHVVGLPDSGFFLDYQAPSGRVGTTIPGNYHDGMAWVFAQQNSTSGLDIDCVEAHQSTGDVYKCIFAEHTAPFITTPTFALQSQYDSWQQGHVLPVKTDPKLMNEMGKNITSRLQSALTSRPHMGAFLDSCNHHCGEWGNIEIDGDVQATAFTKFYYNMTHQTLWNQAKEYPCDSCCGIP